METTLTALELETLAYAIAKSSPAARGKIIERLVARVHSQPGSDGLTVLLNKIYSEMSIAEDIKEYRTSRSGYRNPATHKYRGI